MSLLFMAATIATLVGIYGIAALALNLQFGYGGMINFGVAAFFAIGAYTYALCVLPPASGSYTYLGGWELPIPVAVVIAGLVATVLAFLIGVPTLRLTGEYLAVVTFALAEMIRHLFVNEPAIANGPRGLFGIPLPGIDLVPGREYSFFLACLSLATLFVVWVVMRHVTRSAFARSLLAGRENVTVAASIGKHSYSLRLRAFVFSSFFMGVAGAYYVWYLSILNPSAFSVTITFTIWIAIIIGGVGSNLGAVVGVGVLLVLRESLTYIKVEGIEPATMSSLQDALQGLVLILILLFWRSGLLPRRSRRYRRPAVLDSHGLSPASVATAAIHGESRAVR